MKYREVELTEGECKALVVVMLRRPMEGILSPEKFWSLRRCPAMAMPKRSRFYEQVGGSFCAFCNAIFPYRISWKDGPCPDRFLGRETFDDVLISLLQDNKFELPGVPEDYRWFKPKDPFDMDGD